MKRVSFLFCMHNHQPVGNFEHVFLEAYAKASAPFLSLLEKQPSIKTALHYSGPLLKWFESEQPEFLKRFKALFDGIEKTYQSSSRLAHWKMTLHEKQEQRASVKLCLQEFPNRAARSSWGWINRTYCSKL